MPPEDGPELTVLQTFYIMSIEKGSLFSLPTTHAASWKLNSSSEDMTPKSHVFGLPLALDSQ